MAGHGAQARISAVFAELLFGNKLVTAAVTLLLAVGGSIVFSTQVLRGADGGGDDGPDASLVESHLSATSSEVRSENSTSEAQDNAKSRRTAIALMNRVLEYLTWGPPLEAKLRLRAWAAGREVVEVGSYQQAGLGSGRTSMALQVPIADGKAYWQQICDGRLAWTREELAGEVRVRRVDLGRLDELLDMQAKRAGLEGDAALVDHRLETENSRVAARFRVGGLAEIIDRILADYELRISEGHIEVVAADGEKNNVRMLVVKGTMRELTLAGLKEIGGGTVSPLVPQHVRIAIAADSLDAPLPARIEFWSESSGRLISLLEVYNVATIEQPSAEQFRFEAGTDDFVNETELYLRRFGGGLASRKSAGTLKLK